VLDNAEDLPVPVGGAVGSIARCETAVDDYVAHLVSCVEGRLDGFRLAIDCANGSASTTARKLFAALGADCVFLSDTPNGVNINDGCGSTHLENLSRRVVEGCYDLGIAFDGDADRCLIVDEKGNEVDGDKIMAICARVLQQQGKLHNGGFVATVMSNLGLHKFCRENGLKLLCASVGDRFVLEMMQQEGMVLGGEQSGHIIFLEHMTTGDGQLAALQFLQILSRSGSTVSKLAADIGRYPQVLLNVAAPHDKAGKDAVLKHPKLAEAVAEGEKLLAGDGRILVRPSGTEALIRVMVEAASQQTAQQVAELVADTVKVLQK